MDAANRLHTALKASVLQLLLPVCRLLLRHNVPFGVLEELAKHAYVQVAMDEFSIPGKKPSISRASILTGLTRKFSIPILEYFDRIKLTIRIGDKRVLRKG